MDEPTTRADPPHDPVTALWRRLSEHRIAQWTVGYIAAAYAIQHGVVLTAEAFEWPQAVQRVSMLLFALGLPLVIVFAWYHGEQTTKRISRGELSIISLLLVAIAILFYLFVRPNEASAPAQEASVAAARAAAQNPSGAISIAVMPFANVSQDKDQEFFSDGMTDEIATALAKVPDLRVVARSSAFEFKGQNKEARAIGQALGATHLIEGSVRQAGNRVRIAAQLVRADNGLQIWAENYDRDLTDIFAVQEDIARAITASLRMPLGLKPGENLVNNRQIDSETYQQYLKAKALYRARSMDQALAIAESLVVRDPNYAPAWALLAKVQGTALAYNQASTITLPLEQQRRLFAQTVEKREMAAREAIRLDPKLAGGYASLALVQARRGDWVGADDLLRQALSLDPTDPETLDTFMQFIWVPGRIKEALRVSGQLRSVEPLVPVYGINTAFILLADGQPEAALKMLLAIIPNSPEEKTLHGWELARAYTALGKFSDAAQALLAVPANQNRISRPSLEQAASLLQKLARREPLPNPLPNIVDELGGIIYTYADAPERLADYEQYRAEITGALPARDVWTPKNTALRNSPKFRALVRKMGLVDYWKARGWPDLCHPVGADDFACN